MKIALIRRQFSGTGGAELYLQRLMAGLLSRGHELHLFAENWTKVSGIHLHQVDAGGTRAQRPVRFAQEVQRLVEEMRFDCIFSLERTFRQDVYRAGDGVHKVWLERRREFAPWWKKPFTGRGAFHRNMTELERETFSPDNTKHIVVNSEMVRSEIVQNFNVPPGRIHLVRNGIDLNRFRPGDKLQARARLNLSPDEYILLFVGSGWERKGLKYITNEILPRLNSQRQETAKLLVVGKGREAGLSRENVIFYGTDAQVELAYQAADLFVFLPIYEPSANVCIEAMACGLPVITTKQNGAAEFIAPGVNGAVLNNPTEIDAACDAIKFWRSRKDVPVQIDRAALSIERNVDETMGILEMAARTKEA